jgi:hypothetical protein
MKRFSTIALSLVLLLSVGAAFAQGPPTPAPELKKLDFMVGSWTSDVEMKPGPMGPGGKMTGTSHAEWMDGKFFLVSHGTFEGFMGKGVETSLMGYDTNKKMYTYDAFNSMGEHDSSLGSVDGDNWTWTSDMDMGGMKMKGRFTMKILSPASYTFKYEMSQDGSSWTTVMEGKATKK